VSRPYGCPAPALAEFAHRWVIRRQPEKADASSQNSTRIPAIAAWPRIGSGWDKPLAGLNRASSAALQGEAGEGHDSTFPPRHQVQDPGGSSAGIPACPTCLLLVPSGVGPRASPFAVTSGHSPRGVCQTDRTAAAAARASPLAAVVYRLGHSGRFPRRRWRTRATRWNLPPATRWPLSNAHWQLMFAPRAPEAGWIRPLAAFPGGAGVARRRSGVRARPTRTVPD